MQGGGENHHGSSLNDYIQALAVALELPDESAIQARQGMNAPAGTASQLNTNFSPSAHAQSYTSPSAQDPFAAAAAAAPPAQAHSGAHSAGHSGAYSNHSGGAYNSGASGGQPSHQGNFGYDAQGHAPGGHYQSEVPASNAVMLRGPLDDVWPAPNQHGVSPRQARTDATTLQSAFNMGNGPYPPRPPFGSQHPSHSQLSAPAAPGSRRQSLGGGTSNFLPNFGRAPSEGRENRSTSGYSLGGSDGGPTYPLSGPHSEGGPHARTPDKVQSIVNLNTLGLAQTPASWDGNQFGNSENSEGQGAVAGGYLTPRSLGCNVGRASSAPLAQQPSSQDNSALAAAARPKRRRRNEQQQVNNKLAQQRYREKQKMKTRDLEGQVEELQAQVKALETSSGRSRQLMRENEDLRTQHQQLCVQIGKLQAKLKRIGADGADAMDADQQTAIDSLNFPDSAPHMKGSTAAATISAAGGETPGRPAGDVDMEDRSGGAGDMDSSGPAGAELGNIAKRLQAITEDIRKFLTARGLPTDSVIKDDVRYSELTLRHELAKLLQIHYRACSKALIGKGPESFANMQTDQAAAQEMWGRCLVGIHLDDQQVAQILDVRTKVLQRMNNLGDVRNHLALRAVGILLPSRQRPSTHPSHEARLQSFETNGAFEVLHGEQELQESLDEVTANLAKGRLVITEFNNFFINSVLKVEQAAVLISITHPYLPDCLALANLMAQTRRNVTSGTETRS